MSIAMQIRHTVELNAPLMLRVIPGVLMENDTEANAVVLEITQDGKPCQIDGQTVSATLLREDGNAVLLEGEENGSIATVKLTPACYRVPGTFVMSVRLSNVEGESRTIWRATGRMEAENVGSIVDDEHIVPTLDELLAREDLNDQYLRLTVTDRYAGLDLVARLRDRFPHLLEVYGKSLEESGTLSALSVEELQTMDETGIMKKFMAENFSCEPTPAQMALFADVLAWSKEEGECS